MIAEIDELFREWKRCYSGGADYLGIKTDRSGEKLDKEYDSEPTERAKWMELVICSMSEADKKLVINFYMSSSYVVAVENFKRATGLSHVTMYARLDRIHRQVADKLYKKFAND